MRNRLAKLLAACLSSLVLFAILGCGDGKSPPRIVEDEPQKNKNPDAR